MLRLVSSINLLKNTGITRTIYHFGIVERKLEKPVDGSHAP